MTAYPNNSARGRIAANVARRLSIPAGGPPVTARAAKPEASGRDKKAAASNPTPGEAAASHPYGEVVQSRKAIASLPWRGPWDGAMPCEPGEQDILAIACIAQGGFPRAVMLPGPRTVWVSALGTQWVFLGGQVTQ